MKCPSCIDVNLAMTNRESVEIDYCPKCRGVWLDRGELDKIVQKTESCPVDDDEDYRDDHGQRDRRSHDRHDRRGRKRPWWTEIFD